MDAIQDAYSFFESLNLSVTSLIVIALVLALAFLFSLREATAWFFKIDDMKRELKRLNEASLRIENEIISLQNILDQARHNNPLLNLIPPKDTEPAPSDKKTQEATQKPPPSSSGPSSGFPIVH